jgi:hypothetical protein
VSFHRRSSNLRFLFGSPSTIHHFASRHSRHQTSSGFRIISVRSLNHCAAEVRSPRCHSRHARRGLHRFDGTRRRRPWSSACCPQTTYYTYGAGKCDVAIRLTYGGPFVLERDLVMIAYAHPIIPMHPLFLGF